MPDNKTKTELNIALPKYHIILDYKKRWEGGKGGGKEERMGDWKDILQ